MADFREKRPLPTQNVPIFVENPIVTWCATVEKLAEPLKAVYIEK